MLDGPALDWLAGHVTKVCETIQAKLLACEGGHLHLLVEDSPKLATSARVSLLKGTSSRLLPKARPDLASR